MVEIICMRITFGVIRRIVKSELNKMVREIINNGHKNMRILICGQFESLHTHVETDKSLFFSIYDKIQVRNLVM